mmetsp:Transcript_39014/g.110491  ORF Transcript_39014/g.110491 Transcript_39014/m.110491 type:complete len:134 (-) Transcript_39014:459-860(-)
MCCQLQQHLLITIDPLGERTEAESEGLGSGKVNAISRLSNIACRGLQRRLHTCSRELGSAFLKRISFCGEGLYLSMDLYIDGAEAGGSPSEPEPHSAAVFATQTRHKLPLQIMQHGRLLVPIEDNAFVALAAG